MTVGTPALPTSPAVSSPAPQTGRCLHCGTAVPVDRSTRDATGDFCCSGCQLAFQLIHDHGLGAFYEMARSESHPVGDTAPVASTEFDDPQFLADFAAPLPSGLMRTTLAVEGIHCVACVWLLEKLADTMAGLARIVVNWGTRTAEVTWDPQQVRLSHIALTMRRLGYHPQPFRADREQWREVQESRTHFVRLGVAGAAAGNNMLIALALYLGWFDGMDDQVETLLRWASCLVGLVSLAWPGRVFFQSAWSALRCRVPHMDLPIALGLGIGGISGLINTWRDAGEIYFDSLSVLVFLLLIGRYVQYRQQRRAADAIGLLYRLTPRHAHRVESGQIVDTRAEWLRAGDVVEVRAGEVVPADGCLLSGRAVIDESLLTGESTPCEHQSGQELAAGTVNLASAFRMQITAVGAETRVGKLMRLVETGAGQRPQIVQWANRIGGYFVVAVIALAALTMALWSMVDGSLAVDHATALLIVACPCALAMATPLAIAVALGRAASQGILIKGGDVVQRLHRPGVMWLDKTGTLTQGQMRVVRWHGDRESLEWAAAIERHSAHPVARAIVLHAQDQCAIDPMSATVDSVVQSPAGGIEGWVDGHHVAIGNRPFVAKGIDAPWLPDLEDQFLSAGLSPVYIAIDGTLRSMAGVGDPLRPDAAESIRALRRRGWVVGILSGDHPSLVAQVAEQLNISPSWVFGGVSPEEKVAIIARTSLEPDRPMDRAAGDSNHAPRSAPTATPSTTVVMVGDGVNDSAGLAAASVGIAVHGGSEVSLQAAPVYLHEPGLQSLIRLLDGCQQTLRAIRRNLMVSLAYNALGVSLAMAGVLNPLIAAVLMPISSLTVVSLSLYNNGFAIATPARGRSLLSPGPADR